MPFYVEDVCRVSGAQSVTGRVPILLNGERAEIIIVIDKDHEDGYVAGARFVYGEDETGTVAKGVEALADGDVIDFVCDFYDYDGNYSDSYMLGERITVDGELTVSNVWVDADNCSAMYLLTDIYNNEFHTPVVPD